MSLVKVWTEMDDGECYSLPAKIVSQKGNIITVKYLSVSDKKTPHSNKKIYRYEDETYNITDDSVTEYLNSECEFDFGFEEISEGEFIKYESDSDEDYIPPSEDDDTSSSSESDDNSEDEELSDMEDEIEIDCDCD